MTPNQFLVVVQQALKGAPYNARGELPSGGVKTPLQVGVFSFRR